MREPFWRAQTQYWYVEKDGRQVRLSKLGARNPDGGERKHPPVAVQNESHRQLREGTPKDLQVCDLFSCYLTSLDPGSENYKTGRRQVSRKLTK